MNDPYANGWTAVSRMVRAGASWSGRERNCAFLNLGNNRFANVSAISGLDWQDDGRALAVCDWDGDGDLDLWFKNRTGPQLRLMENTRSPGNFFSLELVGTECNTDAIGARVEVWVAERLIVRTVQAGSGYLAQSSKRLHFGLGTADKVDRIEVTWPGSQSETLPAVEVGSHNRYTQGSGKLERIAPRAVDLTSSAPPQNLPITDVERGTVFREPFPLPDGWLDEVRQENERFSLVTFWAQWCPQCRAELVEINERHESLQRNGIRIVPVNLDSSEDIQSARQLAASWDFGADFQTMDAKRSALAAAILRSTLDLHDGIAIPMSWLLDDRGRLIAVYQGRVSVDAVVRDCKSLAKDPPRTNPERRGRWYSLPTRRYNDVVDELKAAGHLEWARYYLKLDRQAKRQ